MLGKNKVTSDEQQSNATKSSSIIGSTSSFISNLRSMLPNLGARQKNNVAVVPMKDSDQEFSELGDHSTKQDIPDNGAASTSHRAKDYAASAEESGSPGNGPADDNPAAKPTKTSTLSTAFGAVQTAGGSAFRAVQTAVGSRLFGGRGSKVIPDTAIRESASSVADASGEIAAPTGDAAPSSKGSWWKLSTWVKKGDDKDPELAVGTSTGASSGGVPLDSAHGGREYAEEVRPPEQVQHASTSNGKKAGSLLMGAGGLILLLLGGPIGFLVGLLVMGVGMMVARTASSKQEPQFTGVTPSNNNHERLSQIEEATKGIEQQRGLPMHQYYGPPNSPSIPQNHEHGHH